MKDDELVEKLINHPYFGKYEMRVRLQQSSVAVSASVGVEYIYSGIDWDNGNMFIQPDKPLVSWEYIEEYVPDIKQQIEAEQHRRMKEVMKERELEPCHICGGKGINNMAGIYCKKCNAGVSRYQKTNQEVIDAWNNGEVEIDDD